jgi:sucrose phosphorylase
MAEIECVADNLYSKLEVLYGSDDAKIAHKLIHDLIEKYKKTIVSKHYKMSEKDTILITYGDQIQRQGEPHLVTLKKFLDNYLKNIINSIHILPFYPYSSDDGFSVIDYSEVDPKLGSWNEIEDISKDYRLMVDAVINHMSQYSKWFKAYLNRDEDYKDFFIDMDPSTDLSKVVRPRTSPLLTEFTDVDGKVHNIWTTFSSDQVDLNYGSYKLLVAVLDALFYYIEKGTKLIRFDAIAFLWKEIGTNCIHLPQTHELIQLMRDVIHSIAPEIIIVTETNVPHKENISYFGRGDDEAQMVYNFSLPPLLAYSVLTQNTEILTQWAKTLTLPNDKVCFFNFTASHDGVGLRPVSEILDDQQIEFLVQNTIQHGGLVSYRDTEDGHKPYELNCSYIDILSHPDEDDEIRARRMLVTQAVTLSMPGVPGIYFHSLVGSRNYLEGVKFTGINRSINREKFNCDMMQSKLNTDDTIEKMIFSSYRMMISIRTKQKAFNPFGEFEFLDLHKSVFSILQHSLDKTESILALHNFSNDKIELELSNRFNKSLKDLITNVVFEKSDSVILEPYQVMWLKY